MMKTAVQNANYLKENGEELIPRGPQVEIVFRGDGPIGMHIVNVATTLADGTRGPDRVVVASTAEGAQAEGRIFFGEQVMQVGEVSTKGLKMKEVKLMIADAERPIKIVLQPLCFRSTRHHDFPPCPPVPSTFKESQLLWELCSRSHALEDVGPERKVKPSEFLDYYSVEPEFVFIRQVKRADADLMRCGDRIVEVDGKRGKDILPALLQAQYPNASTVVLQQVVVNGIIRCPKCNGREWIYSRFCSRCGTPQKARRI